MSRLLSSSKAILVILSLASMSIHAFSPFSCAAHNVIVRKSDFDPHAGEEPELSRTDRRSLFRHSLATVFVLAFAPPASLAVVMDNSSKEAQVFVIGQDMPLADAKARFLLAKQDLNYLVAHYDSIVAQGGGDNVRRYLGTVGMTSNMYGIMKVLKRLQEEADDIVEYTETMNEFDYSLRAADTACYSANFVEFSAAKTKPEKFFEDALLETERMLVGFDVMTRELKL